MFLIPKEVVFPHIHESYTRCCKDSVLIGFYPATQVAESSYYSVDSPLGGIVPVFLIPNAEYQFGHNGPALYFMGCDDGSTGKFFATQEELFKWLDDCPYMDFSLLYNAAINGETEPLEYFN